MPTIYARKYKIKSQRNESEIPKLHLSLKFILNDTKHGIKKFFFFLYHGQYEHWTQSNRRSVSPATHPDITNGLTLKPLQQQ